MVIKYVWGDWTWDACIDKEEIGLWEDFGMRTWSKAHLAGTEGVTSAKNIV